MSKALAVFWAAIVPVALATISGCGRSDDRKAISGNVTLDGEPLPSGLIHFQPTETATSSAGTTIQNGRYEIPAAQGLKPGKYQVAIQAFKPTGRIIDDRQAGKRPELTPIGFRESDHLSATVAAGGGNAFDFVLTSTKGTP